MVEDVRSNTLDPQNGPHICSFCLMYNTGPVICCRWIINMEGAQGTLYEGEQFQLQFKFSPKYPFDSPEVSAVSTLFKT